MKFLQYFIPEFFHQDDPKFPQTIDLQNSLHPKFLSWIISFFTVAVIRVSHHQFFKQTGLLDNGIFWQNEVLLLRTSFNPFPTAVPGDYPGNPVSLAHP